MQKQGQQEAVGGQRHQAIEQACLLPQTFLEAGGQFSSKLFIDVVHIPSPNPVGQLANRGNSLSRQLGQAVVINNEAAGDAGTMKN